MDYDVEQTCMLVNIGLTRSECASWVQAWGSIAAIFAAVAVAFIQHRQNLKQQRRAVQASHDQAIAAHLAIGETMRHELTTAASFAGGEHLTEWGQALRQTPNVRKELEVFDSIPVHGLPTYEAIHAARQISTLTHEWIACIENIVSAKNAPNFHLDTAAEYLDRAMLLETAVRAEIQFLRLSTRR